MFGRIILIALLATFLGWSLLARTSEGAGKAESYVVRPGDTLSLIAKNNLGSVGRWMEIWELNKGRIADPNLISIGWELLLPQH